MFWTNLTINVLLFIYVIDCVFMGLVIMMQRSKQEGLGAAFGGGITESVWGAQTSQVLVKGTVWAALLFFVLSISLARLYSYRSTRLDQPSSIQQQLLATPGAKTAILPSTPTNSAGAPVVPTATPLSPTTNAPIAAPASTPPK
jgi:preprotein translocase subunit SecG